MATKKHDKHPDKKQGAVQRVITPDQRLDAANRHAKSSGLITVDRLFLNPVRKGIPGIDVHDRITSARATLTIEGASTLEVSIHDPEWLIEQSGILAVGPKGRLDAIDVVLDTLQFRLVKAGRQDPETLTLTFEDRVVALLRTHNKPRTWKRGKFTRGQVFEQMIKEVRETKIPFFSPEKTKKQRIAKPELPDTKPAHGETGFDKGANFKIKGQKADADQAREVATAMGVADQLDAPEKARVAMVTAGIGESGFRVVKNPKTVYSGVFQADPKNIPAKDTQEQARCFLEGGKGFQAGGAIKMSKTTADIGDIVSKVEGSDKGGSFYKPCIPEAKKIVAAWKGGGGASSDSVLHSKAYQFKRGNDGERETSWDAMTRMAEEVQWRLYAIGGVVAFVNDDYLITTPASLVLDNPDGQGLLHRPTYDWDQGKTVHTMNLEVQADRWQVVPGAIAALIGDEWGPVQGRWIVQEVDQNLLEPTDCQITMIKPVAAKKEPAHELSQNSGSDSSSPDKVSADGGAAAIVTQAFEIAKDASGSDIWVASDYRADDRLDSGKLGDHSENNANMAARDIAVKGIDAITGPPSPKLDKAVIAIGKAFHHPFKGGVTIDAVNFQYKGFRIQVIWRTKKYGGHMGHIHVGARKLGYTPKG